MAVNPYFNNFSYGPTQQLIDDLVIEAIRIYGHEVAYIPRVRNNYDDVLNEDSSAEYSSAYDIEMYVKNVYNYAGQGEFLSKFNIEIRDQITLTVAIRTFERLIGDTTGLKRPLEGDLIYFPMDTRLLVIRKVDRYSAFFQTGQLQCYDLVCELFEYSSEKFNTGIEYVDNLERTLSLSTSQHGQRHANGAIVTNGGVPLFDTGFDMEQQTDDTWADNKEIGDAAEDLIDFSEDNPYSSKF